jgi:hypothetical protein
MCIDFDKRDRIVLIIYSEFMKYLGKMWIWYDIILVIYGFEERLCFI